MGGIGPLDQKATSLQGFSIRFLGWVESATLFGEVENVLPQRLAPAGDDENRRHAPGSYNQG